jgi:type IV pilus assembly PilM-like protein
MTRGGPLVCLDFSLNRLCVIEVADGQVPRWTVQPLAPGSLRGGDPADVAALAEGVRWTLRQAGISARRARIALSDDAAVVRVVELPRMPRRHLKGALRYLSEQQTPFPPGQANLAWDVLERRGDMQRVYLSAAWTDVVQRLAETARAAGLEPEVMEPRSLAVGRAVGTEQAIVVDAAEMQVRLTYVARAQAPFIDEALLTPNAEWEAVNRLLGRALRTQGSAPPLVLLAGDLEPAADRREAAALIVRARAASETLNGHGPTRPPGMPAGALLGPIGLAMRGSREAGGPAYPEVNLLGSGLTEDWRQAVSTGAAGIARRLRTTLARHPHIRPGP